MENKLYSYTIMPLDIAHLEEICQDIKYQQDAGIANMALFKMTLVPEGNPPANKAEILCAQFAKFKQRLGEMGIECGILVQASVGHGWILGELFPYQTHVNFTDGVATRCACPCDEGFKEYIYNVMVTLAKHEPAHIMIDDDFRTIWFKGEGCACPLHMKMFNERAKTNLTDRELWKIVNEKSEKTKEYTDIFIDCQRDSLIETAKVMRQGVDSVNPKLPMSYCCCGNNAEFAAELGSIFAGEGNPVTVRINNGNYTPQGARYLSRVFHRAATQIAKLKGRVDVILAETDTCPQNRYSVSAQGMHAHYTGSILEGVTGAKHWITRLLTHEPESGEKYRKILQKNRGFYETLAALVPTLKWQGCRIFVPSTPDFTYGRVKEEWDGWSYCVLERLGIPMYFSSENGGVACLEGDVDTRLDDKKIEELLRGKVILASDTAKNLIDRGFGKYLGVEVREWKGKQPVREIHKNGSHTNIQMQIKELVPTSEKTVADSFVCNTTDYESYEELFPAVTVFDNELGGRVIVFCGTPVAEFHLSTAFSFLNYTRKEQLIRLLKDAGELDVYYPKDEETYFKAAKRENGDTLCALFNIGLDPIDKVELVCGFNPKDFKRLMPSGEFVSVSFEKKNDRYILDTSAQILDPVIIIIEK